MKKFFNYIFMLATLLVVGAVNVSCEKEEQSNSEGKYAMTINATKAGNGSKHLGIENGELKATWTAGDVVKVYKEDIEVGSLTAESSGTSTKLSGSITGSIAQGDNLKLKFLSTNYSSQDGTLTGNETSIDKVCDYAEADVTVASISGNEIRIEGSSAEFVNKQSIVKFILKNSDGSAALGNPEYLQVSNSSGVGTVLLSDIPTATYTTNGGDGVLYVAIPGFEDKNVTVDAYLNGSRYSFTKNSITFIDGKYYEIMVKMTYMNLIDLSKVKSDVTLQDGTTVIGTLANNVKISIAAGATVTLSDATINGVSNSSYSWAGLTCIGDATIILADGTTNSVKGFYEDYPGIHIPSSRSLTIQGETAGTGSLTASSNGYGAGIGGGLMISCGSISISGGSITATGEDYAAGIGCGYESSCGDITISGGTVTATGGDHAADIGSGYSSSSCGIISISGGTVTATGGDNAAGIGSGEGYSSCGNIIINGGTVKATGDTYGAGIGSVGSNSVCGDITIANTVTRVTAIKGEAAAYSIGGEYDCCGKVKFGNATVFDGSDWTADPMEAGNYGGLTLAISTTTNDDDTWTLTPIPVKSLSEATSEDVGKVAGQNGKIYDNAAAATAAGTTAVAKIIYVGSSTGASSPYTHGLALALTDESTSIYWPDAQTACDGKNSSVPVTGASWMQASESQ